MFKSLRKTPAKLSSMENIAGDFSTSSYSSTQEGRISGTDSRRKASKRSSLLAFLSRKKDDSPGEKIRSPLSLSSTLGNRSEFTFSSQQPSTSSADDLILSQNDRRLSDQRPPSPRHHPQHHSSTQSIIDVDSSADHGPIDVGSAAPSLSTFKPLRKKAPAPLPPQNISSLSILASQVNNAIAVEEQCNNTGTKLSPSKSSASPSSTSALPIRRWGSDALIPGETAPELNTERFVNTTNFASPISPTYSTADQYITVSFQNSPHLPTLDALRGEEDDDKRRTCSTNSEERSVETEGREPSTVNGGCDGWRRTRPRQSGNVSRSYQDIGPTARDVFYVDCSSPQSDSTDVRREDIRLDDSLKEADWSRSSGFCDSFGSVVDDDGTLGEEQSEARLSRAVGSSPSLTGREESRPTARKPRPQSMVGINTLGLRSFNGFEALVQTNSVLINELARTVAVEGRSGADGGHSRRQIESVQAPMAPKRTKRRAPQITGSIPNINNISCVASTADLSTNVPPSKLSTRPCVFIAPPPPDTPPSSPEVTNNSAVIPSVYYDYYSRLLPENFERSTVTNGKTIGSEYDVIKYQLDDSILGAQDSSTQVYLTRADSLESEASSLPADDDDISSDHGNDIPANDLISFPEVGAQIDRLSESMHNPNFPLVASGDQLDPNTKFKHLPSSDHSDGEMLILQKIHESSGCDFRDVTKLEETTMTFNSSDDLEQRSECDLTVEYERVDNITDSCSVAQQPGSGSQPQFESASDKLLANTNMILKTTESQCVANEISNQSTENTSTHILNREDDDLDPDEVIELSLPKPKFPSMVNTNLSTSLPMQASRNQIPTVKESDYESGIELSVVNILDDFEIELSRLENSPRASVNDLNMTENEDDDMDEITLPLPKKKEILITSTSTGLVEPLNTTYFNKNSNDASECQVFEPIQHCSNPSHGQSEIYVANSYSDSNNDNHFTSLVADLLTNENFDAGSVGEDSDELEVVLPAPRRISNNSGQQHALDLNPMFSERPPVFPGSNREIFSSWAHTAQFENDGANDYMQPAAFLEPAIDIIDSKKILTSHSGMDEAKADVFSNDGTKLNEHFQMSDFQVNADVQEDKVTLPTLADDWKNLLKIGNLRDFYQPRTLADRIQELELSLEQDQESFSQPATKTGLEIKDLNDSEESNGYSFYFSPGGCNGNDASLKEEKLVISHERRGGHNESQMLVEQGLTGLKESLTESKDTQQEATSHAFHSEANHSCEPTAIMDSCNFNTATSDQLPFSTAVNEIVSTQKCSYSVGSPAVQEINTPTSAISSFHDNIRLDKYPPENNSSFRTRSDKIAPIDSVSMTTEITPRSSSQSSTVESMTEFDQGNVFNEIREPCSEAKAGRRTLNLARQFENLSSGSAVALNNGSNAAEPINRRKSLVIFSSPSAILSNQLVTNAAVTTQDETLGTWSSRKSLPTSSKLYSDDVRPKPLSSVDTFTTRSRSKSVEMITSSEALESNGTVPGNADAGSVFAAVFYGAKAAFETPRDAILTDVNRRSTPRRNTTEMSSCVTTNPRPNNDEDCSLDIKAANINENLRFGTSNSGYSKTTNNTIKSNNIVGQQKSGAYSAAKTSPLITPGIAAGTGDRKFPYTAMPLKRVILVEKTPESNIQRSSEVIPRGSPPVTAATTASKMIQPTAPSQPVGMYSVSSLLSSLSSTSSTLPRVDIVDSTATTSRHSTVSTRDMIASFVTNDTSSVKHSKVSSKDENGVVISFSGSSAGAKSKASPGERKENAKPPSSIGPGGFDTTTDNSFNKRIPRVTETDVVVGGGRGSSVAKRLPEAQLTKTKLEIASSQVTNRTAPDAKSTKYEVAAVSKPTSVAVTQRGENISGRKFQSGRGKSLQLEDAGREGMLAGAGQKNEVLEEDGAKMSSELLWAKASLKSAQSRGGNGLSMRFNGDGTRCSYT